MYKVFVDGSEGTTGLRIHSRLKDRPELEVVTLPDEIRKDPQARKAAVNDCDIAFLCLPDAAAKETVSLIDNPDVRVLDTSTAHRTDADWAYGFPELSEERRRSVRTSKRIAVPGCHAGGFISLIYPLVSAGILKADALLCCTSVTGYSGGGRKMIAQYEAQDRDGLLSSPRQYGIAQEHKHLKEMRIISGLEAPPAFSPIVGDFYSGMAVSVPLFKEQLCSGASVGDIKDAYARLYTGRVVRWSEGADEGGFIAANALSGTDCMEISVFGNEERILLVSRFDNLGKGASGAAVQCMNIMLGLDECTGLNV